MAKVAERANKMVAGDPLHPKTRLGAIVSKEQMDNVMRYIDAGKKEGEQAPGVPPNVPPNAPPNVPPNAPQGQKG